MKAEAMSKDIPTVEGLMNIAARLEQAANGMAHGTGGPAFYVQQDLRNAARSDLRAYATRLASSGNCDAEREVVVAMTPALRIEIGKTYVDRSGYKRKVVREVPYGSEAEALIGDSRNVKWFEVAFVDYGVLESHNGSEFVSRAGVDGWRSESGRSFSGNASHDLIAEVTEDSAASEPPSAVPTTQWRDAWMTEAIALADKYAKGDQQARTTLHLHLSGGVPAQTEDDDLVWEHPCQFRGEPIITHSGKHCAYCGMRESDINDAAVSAPLFQSTYCSQCGANLGPGNQGVSSCCDHGACQALARGEECACGRKERQAEAVPTTQPAPVPSAAEAAPVGYITRADLARLQADTRAVVPVMGVGHPHPFADLPVYTRADTAPRAAIDMGEVDRLLLAFKIAYRNGPMGELDDAERALIDYIRTATTPASEAMEVLRELVKVAEGLLAWCKAVPEDTALPIMPGVDGDWVDETLDRARSLLKGTP